MPLCTTVADAVDSKTFYQYALLNLAILQADFGCYKEAVTAMQETVNTARENKDMSCLTFALSWFYHFHKAHPQECPAVIAERMERDSLQFLKVKAKESGMFHLLAMAHLSEVKQTLSNVSPAHILASSALMMRRESLYQWLSRASR